MVEMARQGNIASRSDLEVGAKALEAGLWGASRNVLINLAGISDEAFRTAAAAEADAIAERARTQLDAVVTILAGR
jgi:glutamate formiminotransferase/formiminotetrahydrofolate cyclodeaminase